MSLDQTRIRPVVPRQLSVNASLDNPSGRRVPISPVPHSGSFPRHNQPMDRTRIENIEKKLDSILSILASGKVPSPPSIDGVDPKLLLQEQQQLDNGMVYETQRSGEQISGEYDESGSEDEFERLEFIQHKSNSRMKVMKGTGEVVEDGPPIVLNESDRWMINPKNTFRMSWDLGVIMPLLVYLTLVMPFRLCFENEATQFSAMYWFEFLIDMLFIMDIILNFRTGYVIDVDGGGGGATEVDELVEYDRFRVAWSYIKSWFVLDVISGVPFALLELVLSSSGSTGDLKSAKALKLLRFLKLGRLLKMDKILSNLDRDTLDIIEDFFQNGSTRSAVVMMKLVFYMAYVCHLMACGFVLVGRLCSKEGLDCWFDHEDTNGHGPYHAADTTGGELVFSIYIAAFYFCLTTMTSVGYGDIVPHNNTERIYIILLEFIGAVIFATIIAAITSVVTSMDMNARKTAEQLDAVASFVAVRQFPEHMAKRIRRHFRHFYSLKSAIDETKIFSELSSSLRKEVSEYLIYVLMGRESIFTTMSSTLWPRLLPLLRPMSFEKDEVVCKQKEECTEMYVVLVGTLRGVTLSSAEEREYDSYSPRIRHVVTGKSVNVLHVLGVWHECIETVTAEVAVESYAVSEIDFFSLFTSKSDKDSFERMRQKETLSFKAIPLETAPAGIKPLHFSCFSIVEVSVLKLRQPDLKNAGFNETIHSSDKYHGLESQKKSSGQAVWVIIDLVHVETGIVINDLWRHRTERKDVAARTMVDRGGVSKGRPSVQVSDTDFAGEARWTDISEKFENCMLRLRVMTGSVGKETILASLQLSLSALEQQANFKPSQKKDPPTKLEGDKNSGGLVSPPSGNSLDSFDTAMDSKMMDSSELDTGVKFSRVNSGNLKDEEEDWPISEFRALTDESEIDYVHDCLHEHVMKVRAEQEEKLQKEKEREDKHDHKHHKNKKKQKKTESDDDLFAPPSPSTDLSQRAYLIPRENEIIGWFDLDEGKGGQPTSTTNTSGNSGPSSEDPHKVVKRSTGLVSSVTGYVGGTGSSMSDTDSLTDHQKSPELTNKLLLKVRVRQPDAYVKKKTNNGSFRRRSTSMMEGGQQIQKVSSASRINSRAIDSSPRFSKHKSSGGVLNSPSGIISPTSPPPPTPFSSSSSPQRPQQSQSQREPNQSPSISPSPARSRSANIITQRKLAAQAAQVHTQTNSLHSKHTPSPRKITNKNEDFEAGVALAEL